MTTAATGFRLVADYRMTGDQPAAVDKLVEGLRGGHKYQTLLGVTGSGKTFTMANVIARYNRPTLVISPNKTLAAQLYSEFREFFPESAVQFFVSYYDYYQPEAYIPRTDTYIAKDADINEEIDKLRHAATRALFERRDVVIVASVSEERAVRVDFFGEEVERLLQLDPLTGEVLGEMDAVDIYPAKHFVTSQDKLEQAIGDIEAELAERPEWFLPPGRHP